MLKIRLRRMGNRNRPLYRVVVSDSRKVATSDAIEELGFYHPGQGSEQIKIDAERVRHWVAQGAQLSPTVKKLLGRRSEAPAEA